MNKPAKIYKNQTGNKPLFRVAMVLCLTLAFTWSVQNAYGAPDRFEVDDTPEIAGEIFIEDSSFPDPLPPEDFRNFHSPDDVDWVIFFAPVVVPDGSTFTIQVQAEVDGGNTTETPPDFTVFDESGVNACATAQIEVTAEDKCLIEGQTFTPFVEGYYYIKLVNSSTELFDEETAYTIRIGGVFTNLIHGFVRDANTNEALPGATIQILGTQLSGQSNVSPKPGYYVLLLQGAQNISVAAIREGYQDFLISNVVTNDNELKLDIDMIPEISTDLLVAFITRFYRLILDREPDPQGLFGWLTNLSNQTLTGADLARNFIFSTEFIDRNKNDVEFLSILYLSFFDRKPDTAGYNAWLDLLRAGTERGDILNGFLGSQEFFELATRFGIRATRTQQELLVIDFVTRFYQLILDREPDSLAQGWVDDLLSGRSAGCDIAFGFVFSPEFINRNTSNEAYVDILYQAFFNRAADLAGKNGWLNLLQSGSPREDVLDGFLFSQEFANLAASFGIIACAAPAS